MRITSNLIAFIRSQQFSGFLLLGATICSLIVANSSYSPGYARFWSHEIGFSTGLVSMHHSIEHWINDGLMAIFFLLVALEIKRALLEGELSSVQRAALPVFAAIGGMIVPAALYILVNYDSEFSSGFGIPMATDIAFAIGVLALLGRRIPVQLKIFLLALAVIDDLGAIVVIALFYAKHFSLAYFILAIGITLVLAVLNLLKVRSLPIYIVLGLVLWYVVFMSGIHSTIAGVVLAFTIPGGKEEEHTLTEKLESALNIPVNYFIMPLFALANTAIRFEGDFVSQVTSPVGLGIMLGLVLGKPLGIFIVTYLSVKIKLAKLPDDLRLSHIFGAGLLGGIGFTMSIFISMLAFENIEVQNGAKITVLSASLLAGVLGYLYLRRIVKREFRKGFYK